MAPETCIFFVEIPAAEQRTLLCRWVEHLYEAGRKVQVVADSSMAAQHLDELLWTFSQGSFIPHRIVGPEIVQPLIEPVVVTVGETALDGFDVLIGEAPLSLDFMRPYPLVVHFVLCDDEERRQQSRLLWLAARDHGIKVRHIPQASAMDWKILQCVS